MTTMILSPGVTRS